jgi:chorismate mutase
MAEEEFKSLRDEIDQIDEEIVRLLSERAERALEIGLMKRSGGMPIYSPEREEEVLSLVKKANRGKLSDEAIRRLFERIIDESRRLERETHADDD